MSTPSPVVAGAEAYAAPSALRERTANRTTAFLAEHLGADHA